MVEVIYKNKNKGSKQAPRAIKLSELVCFFIIPDNLPYIWPNKIKEGLKCVEDQE